MKRILVLILLLLVASAAFAEEQILFSGKMESGAWAAPVVKFSSFSDQFAVLAGAQGGWIVNHRGLLGLGIYGLATKHRPPQDPYRYDLYGYDFYRVSTRAEMFYAGAIFGYVVESNKLLHTTFDVLVGGGALTLSDEKGEDDFYNGNDYPNDGFFVAEPSIAAEINMTTYFRMNIGMGYRFVNGANSWGFNNSNTSGPVGTIIFKFGKF
ncbi:hypothetical protein EHM69_09055 [candidate division KSB1 bacterium]|nr:MAG: hypothetical protein EHM69_09055 [candidate division KSB1 bacterium]